MSTTVRATVYVQPRASRTELAGLHDGCVKIRLAAPPVEGAANAELIEFVARLLKIARSRVRVVTGTSSRRKVIEIDGVSAAAVARALGQ
jgi:uncharacterized protein